MKPARFLAIVDPGASSVGARRRSRATKQQGLLPVFDSGPLSVFVTAETHVVRAGNQGLVIGDLFRAGMSSRVTSLDGDETRAGEPIAMDRYWGDYVAFAAAGEGKGPLSIARSASGGVHAFRARFGPILCIASDIELLIDPTMQPPKIDWAFVAHHLAFMHLHCAGTGIVGIDEILPGDCSIEHDGSSERRSLWTPWIFTAHDKHAPSFADATARVRGAVLKATAALVPPDETVLLELSGGLDSSIVAAALAAVGRRAIAANLATPGPEGDERHYARAVSEKTGIALLEALIDGEIDLTEVGRRLEARPGMLAILRLADRYFAEQGRDHRIGAFVNGTGGDCVFCSLGTAAPATDRLKAHGPFTGFATTVRDVARVHGDNIWNVTRMALRRHWRRPPLPAWRRNQLFLNDDCLPAAPSYHPWLDAPPDTPSGTRAHVHAIVASYAHLDGYGRHAVAPSLFPLLSQPVVEACLSIPTWLWVAGGRDRAVARAAFRTELPRIVAERRTKGGMDAFCAHMFEINRIRLRPFLLDGQLAAAGLLDCRAIEAYLARPFTNRDQLFYQLLPIVDAEAWAYGVTAASS
ncbi:asparagine synthetase B family protein [Sphingopyxis sp. GC21]|uniref:asparagine synthase-related protein n=1 Tax=Sphingopyxis sp. GC21 TaxID=2933562 RepID=UPI0021E37A6B|nr:asparagine synthetase B family protein [Sphingopyxis sp. GC21]